MYDDLWSGVSVPLAVISNDDLSSGARFLFVTLLSLCPPGSRQCSLPLPQLLAATCFRSRKALRGYLVELQNSGLLTMVRRPGPRAIAYTLRPPAGRGGSVKIPLRLVLHPELRPAAKWLYIWLLAQCRADARQFTAERPHLAALVGLGVDALHGRTAELVQAGWLRVSRSTRPVRVTYELLDPHLALRETTLKRVMARLATQEYKGETLMKEMLNIAVVDDDYLDNARPEFLRNPVTRERLELDRWYVGARVGIEFNGPQHYEPTPAFSDNEETRQQRIRDLIKLALAYEHGIRLVTFRPQDLSFARLSEKLSGLLPWRELSRDDPVVRYLETASRVYARAAVASTPNHPDA